MQDARARELYGQMLCVKCGKRLRYDPLVGKVCSGCYTAQEYCHCR
jgi:NMD protein affecting ribosome stability and mRNA decay